MRPRSILTLSLTWLLLSLQPTPAQAEIIYALSYPFQGGRIASFDSNSPGALLSLQRITGVVDNEQLEGIDIRPADGKLYAWGSGNENLYTIDPATGIATVASRIHFVQQLPEFFTAGGFDFDPVSDSLRVVAGSPFDATNLRV